MARAAYCACALLLLCPLALTSHDDDFAFDSSEELQVELTANHSEITKNGLRRLWGVPDTSAYVGHLFRMEIPKEAFSGPVVAYKVRNEDGRTPSWLAVDSKHGLISGVPLSPELGPHTLIVTAHGRTKGLAAKDTFTVEVKKASDKPQSKYGACGGLQSRLVLVILVDQPFGRIPARHRIRALMELASFMAVDGDEFSIEPYKSDAAHDQAVLMSGPGNTRKRRGDALTAIHLNVGCGDKLWLRHKVLVAGLREQSRDGTLAHILRLPVLGWRLIAVKPVPRSKRQLNTADDGSGGYDYDNEDDNLDGDYSGYDDDDDEYAYTHVEAAEPVDPSPVPPPEPSHPHRHHHGEINAPSTPHTFQTDAAPTTLLTPPTTIPTTSTPLPTTLATLPTTILTTTTSTTPTPLTTTEETTIEEVTTESTPSNVFTTEELKVKIEPYPESVSEASNVDYALKPAPANPRRLNHSPVIIVPETDVPTTTEETQTVKIHASDDLPLPSSELPAIASPPPPATEATTPVASTLTTVTTTSTTTPAPIVTVASATESTTVVTTPSLPPPTMPTILPVTTPTPETTIEEVDKEPVSFTERSSTVFGTTTETVITIPMPTNQPPNLKHHMKKLAIAAGKAFRYIIPADLFTDPEGGNLTFTMYEGENVPLSKNSWIQFMPQDREVYGLPLESHVSRWNYIVEARDSGGEVARGPLDITVQQHKSSRRINHQFILQFKLSRPQAHPIDWQIRALEGIVNLFRDTDMDHLTVLNATQSGDMCEFVWTNDTLPMEPNCPMQDINRLMKIMESESERGSPSAALARAMSPELKIAHVSWRGVGACAGAGSTPSPATRAPDTYPPVTRNQVDHLTATAGHLLVYKVPEDTFFDPEDLGTRNLHLSLRFSDRSELPRPHWLQFDANNQEFYGLPAPSDVGSLQYQLVAEDSSKKSAYDSLIVEVVKAPAIKPTVEFQMTMEYPFPQLAYSAATKRKVLEKLAALFGQTDTNSIRIQSITDNPTTIIWYNTSLPMDRCPKEEIEELRKMIIADERGSSGAALKENVDQIFDKDFKVMSIRLIPLSLCAEQNTKTPKNAHVPVQTGTNVQNSKAESASDGGYTEYLVTFVIPAVVIVCMILVAGIIACVLYRRRRTGKMSVGDEEERQAFRSKGIPVIFQDELEEQAGTEPLHKSPVIMREEKPPLLPPAPDYRTSAPYRPPPPVAPATTPPRPKATPTYRKPPPYVPP